jgi:ectoine hydroxylase-related dioxygenase (phytanoyl-CoA dioxygenase family)
MSDRVAVESEGIGAEMKRGSALIYVGRTYHGKDKRPLLRDEFARLVYVTPAPLAGAGANSTDQTRVALNIAYNSSYLKQECNTFVTATPKVVRQMQLPSLVTELLGYAGDEAKFLALGGDGVEEHQAVARL